MPMKGDSGMDKLIKHGIGRLEIRFSFEKRSVHICMSSYRISQ